MISFHKFWVVLPVVVLVDPSHHQLAIVVLSSVALAQTDTGPFALSEERTPKRCVLFDY